MKKKIIYKSRDVVLKYRRGEKYMSIRYFVPSLEEIILASPFHFFFIYTHMYIYTHMCIGIYMNI